MPFSMAGLPQQGNYLVFSKFEMPGKKKKTKTENKQGYPKI